MNTSLYLGIDVSKGYADFIMLNAARKIVGEPCQLYDVKEGYEALDLYLETAVAKYHPEQIYAAVESTGSLENRWLEVVYGMRHKYHIKVARLNPLGVARHRQADMKVQITDRTSSEAIARYLINHADRIEYYKPDDYTRLRLFLSQIELLVKHKVQLANKLHQHLYLYFPEVLPYVRNSMPKSVLKLLEMYPSSHAMSRARKCKNNSIPYFRESAWLQLRDRSRLGVYDAPDPLAEMMVRDTARQIMDLEEKISKMYDLLYSQFPQDKLQILMSIPGIAKVAAVTLLCLIGDVNRFESPHQIVGYFGLYPVIKESGDGRKKPHLSRKGNRLLRKRLYMSAMVACQHDPYLRSLYMKLVDRGVPKKSAICVMMKKMLRMIYGMLRNNQCYNPDVDALYRERYQNADHDNRLAEPDISQEVTQDMTDIAPISKKNAYHRKEQTRAHVQTRSPGQLLAAPSNFLPKSG